MSDKGDSARQPVSYLFIPISTFDFDEGDADGIGLGDLFVVVSGLKARLVLVPHSIDPDGTCIRKTRNAAILDPDRQLKTKKKTK